jgi:hypothetical protein
LVTRAKRDEVRPPGRRLGKSCLCLIWLDLGSRGDHAGMGFIHARMGHSAHCHWHHRGPQWRGRLCGRNDARLRLASVVRPRGARALSCLRGPRRHEAGNHRLVALPGMWTRRSRTCSRPGREREQGWGTRRLRLPWPRPRDGRRSPSRSGRPAGISELPRTY